MSLKGDAIIQYCETYIGRICARDTTEKRDGRGIHHIIKNVTGGRQVME